MFNRHNETAKMRDKNHGLLDAEYKGREPSAGLNMVFRNGDYDAALLGYNKCSPEAALRNFNAKSKDQQQTFPDMAYSRLQQHQATLDPRLSNLHQILPTSGMFPHQIATPSFNRNYGYEMLHPFLSYPLSREVSPYGMDRRTNLQQSYAQSGHLGLAQSSTNFSPYADFTKSEMERGAFPKYPPRYSSPLELTKPGNDSDPHASSRRTPRHDDFPPYLNSCPRSASTLPDFGRKYHQSIGDNFGAGSFSTNGLKHNGPPTVDLTLSNSPDAPIHEDQRNEQQLRDRSGPIVTQQHRELPKENGSHLQADVVKDRDYSRNKKNQPTGSQHYPTSSLSPFAGLLPFHPSALTNYSSMTSGSYNSFNNPSADVAKSRSLSKGIEHTVAKPSPPQWPVATRYHTPSPHTYSSLETMKKSGSPSLQLKTKPPTLVSDLTFNYPEGSGSKPEIKAQPTTKYLDNGINAAKTQLWPKKDDSKLSPLENEIMDSARDGKPPNFSKYENLPHARSRMAPSHVMSNHQLFNNRPVRPPDYPQPKHFPSVSAIPRNPPEGPRNSVSVIQSVPKSTQSEECLSNANKTGKKYNDSFVQGKAIENKSEQKDIDGQVPEKTEVTMTAGAEYHASGLDSKKEIALDKNTSKPGRKRKSSKTKEGEQRPKRKYTKRSDVWKKKGLQQKQEQGAQPEETQKKELSGQPNEEPLPKQPKEPQQTVPGPALRPQQSELATPTELQEDDPDMAEESQKNEPALVEKISRPQRKSQGLEIEEYLYGWFSEEESENDDSSDEDYSCPANVNRNRACKGLSSLRQRRRMPVRRSSDCIRTRGASYDSDKDYHLHGDLKKSRRGRKRIEERETNYDKVEKTTPEKESEDNDTRDVVTKEKSEQESHVVDKATASLVEQQKTLELKEIQPTSDSIGKTAPMPRLQPTDQIKLSENQEPEVQEVQGPPVRKKRKYTRRADRPLKPTDLIPKKKRKYTKTAEKWFKKKAPSESPLKQVNKIPSNICPSLAELYTNGQHVRTLTEDQESKEKPVSIDSALSIQKSPRRRISSNQSTPSTAISPSLSEYVPATNDKLKGDTVSPNEEGTPVEMKHDNNNTHNSTAECSSANDPPVPVKIPKKRGRKPGRKKLLQLAKDGVPSSTATLSSVKRRYKKPKGDGLSRFGMRKKGRKPTLKRPIAAGPIVSTPTRSQGPAKQQPGEVRQKRKYNVHSRREKRRQYLIREGRIAEAKALPTTSQVVTLVKEKPVEKHKISEELQSQEYDYDFKASLLYDNTEEEEIDDKDASLSKIIQDDSSELPSSSLPQSRPQTPTDGMSLSQQSPFPSHLKKLCCNSAIGETQLHKAARIGYTENLQYYLETGTNVNLSDNAGYTALHEACMRNNLEAASLLLQYGADVNKYAVDGTRPLHDAIEYDHLEMVRLMLGCGADPMLSKFSGRSIPNMIIKRSQRMKQFINAYLKELKNFKDSEKPDEDLKWKFPSSAVFDDVKEHQCSTLAFPPDEEELFAEFEMFGKPPSNTYLLQADDESERRNYCLLDDYLNTSGKYKGKSSDSIRILSLPVDSFRSQIKENLIQKLQYEKSCSKPDLSCEFVEVVAVENCHTESSKAEIIKIPLLDKRDQNGQRCSGHRCKEASQSQYGNTVPYDHVEHRVEDPETLSTKLSHEDCETTSKVSVDLNAKQLDSTGNVPIALPEKSCDTGCKGGHDIEKSAPEKTQDMPSCQKEISNGWTNAPDLHKTGSTTVDEVR